MSQLSDDRSSQDYKLFIGIQKELSVMWVSEREIDVLEYTGLKITVCDFIY